ncbi:hypothetical protein D9757_001073 [Collybiopsis confluens]|uniref:Uncharacterized protein n=1 Tax=Collybiopsis confluens TaxID=2823264 RepID=A0A8H5HZY0_9AGAR|nr:hypothetical protein D9757_001073 [Collybiopsis confluens]
MLAPVSPSCNPTPSMSFSMNHSILLPHSIESVFHVLSDSTEMERLQRLTPEAQQFAILKQDFVTLPDDTLASLKPGGQSLPASCPRPRELPSNSSYSKDPDSTEINPTGTLRTFPRTYFEFSGTVPILFGLMHRPLSVSGAQIVDEEAKVVLFESGVAASGIKEVKLRTFRAVEDPNESDSDKDDGEIGRTDRWTEVKEHVWGTCPFGLSLLLKALAPKVHREHMELYHKLFETPTVSADI